MSFFKKFFGKKNEETQSNNEQSSNDEPSWMTDSRRENLAICHQAGFRPAGWLPIDSDREVRPAIEIAKRLCALKAAIIWLMAPEEHISTETILDFVSRNKLADFMAEDELNILKLARDDENGRDFIGWKFENAWPLVWYFGYEKPDMYGNMMTGEQIQQILSDYCCPLDENVTEWIARRNAAVTAELVDKTEDLFYCLHNAVRSAQLGSDTVPPGFDPRANGGVIHERRHALTWMLSTGVDWDDTDLST